MTLEFCFKGGGCGVGLGLGWGFGTAFGSKYRSSRVRFQGMEFDKKDHSDGASFKELSKRTPLSYQKEPRKFVLRNSFAFWSLLFNAVTE